MVRPQGESEFQYRLLALDVKGTTLRSTLTPHFLTTVGHPRIFLENVSESALGGKKSPLSIFGVKWR